MDTIKSEWINWANSDKCPLCNKEGKDIANVWKKGHKRANGIILETGLSYCEKCANTPECEEHWNKWFQAKWQEQEKRCEDNWEKYGVYTNVGTLDMPSFYFGYVKTPEGLVRYLQVYPDCPKYKLLQKISKLLWGYKENSQKLQEINELVDLADVSPEFKAEIRESAAKFIKTMPNRDIC